MKIPIYDIKMWVYIGEVNNFKSEIKKKIKNVDIVDDLIKFIDTSALEGCTLSIPDPDIQLIIYLQDYTGSAKDIGVLTHEVLHAVFRITDGKGIILCDESEESFTYLTGYITEEIIKKIKL